MAILVAQINSPATIVQGKKKDVPEEGGGCSGPDISFLFLLKNFACSDRFRHNSAGEERCARMGDGGVCGGRGGGGVSLRTTQ